jgi:hypothetical protein
MFLRRYRRIKDGKEHFYYALVESVRTKAGPRQHVGLLRGVRAGFRFSSSFKRPMLLSSPKGRLASSEMGSLGDMRCNSDVLPDRPGASRAIHTTGRPASPKMGNLGDMRSSATCSQIVGVGRRARSAGASIIVGSSPIRSLGTGSLRPGSRTVPGMDHVNGGPAPGRRRLRPSHPATHANTPPSLDT